MHNFFRWIPYSLRNVLTRVENLSQPALLVGNGLSKFVGFQLKLIMGALSNSEHPRLFWPYLPHPDSKSCTFLSLDPLLFEKCVEKFESFSQPY